MAIECFETRFWNMWEQTTRLQPGEKVTINNGDHSGQLIIRTPNVVEFAPNYSPEDTTLYVRGKIELNSRTVADRFIGRNKLYSWTPSFPEEDEPFADLEKQLLRHRLVGHYCAALVGKSQLGFDKRLLDQGGRVETITRRGQRGGTERFLRTTNVVWTKVFVEEGLAKNVYGQDRKNPSLRVRVMEGPYQSQTMAARENDLKGIHEPKPLQERTRKNTPVGTNHPDELADDVYYYPTLDLVYLGSHPPALILPDEQIQAIRETGVSPDYTQGSGRIEHTGWDTTLGGNDTAPLDYGSPTSDSGGSGGSVE